MHQQLDKGLGRGGMREMIDTKSLMKEISLQIINEKELNSNPTFVDRIIFFYDYSIRACLEYKPEIVTTVINEICAFEKKWYTSNIRNLSLLEDYSVVNCISLFSAISYQLAKDKFDGCKYHFINIFLENLFKGFLEVASEKPDFIEMFKEEFSDIELNFLYACGHSNVMGLTLYTSMMKNDKKGN